MDKEFLFNNKKYISSKYAGKISGYTNDYVARLARQGKIDGRMIGRTWYVEEESLNDFIEHNKLQKEQLHEKLSDKRIQDYKYSEQNKKAREAFQSVASKISKAPQIFKYEYEFVKKGIAVIIAIAVVSGGYFAKDTDIAKAGFKKVSDIAVMSMNAVATFDPSDFADFTKDVALNIHNGIDKTKPTVIKISSSMYLLASGDKGTWTGLGVSLKDSAKDAKDITTDISRSSAIFTRNIISSLSVLAVDSFKDTAVAVSKLSYTDIKNDFNDTLTTPLSYVAKDLYLTAQTISSNISYNVKHSVFNISRDIQDAGANVFTSIVGSIREGMTTTLEDEAVYIYTTTNRILCNTFFLPEMCQRDQRNKSDTVLTQSQPQEQIETQEAPRTVINQPVIERVVETERILTVSGITKDDMELAIQQLKNKVYSDMSNLTSANETRIVNNYKVISQTNKIDKLGNITISNSTISGTLTGLTDAHIPDDITASNYLPLSGGTLTGAITTTGSLGIGTTSPYTALGVAGEIVADSITATSTSATSTFAGQVGITFSPVIAHTFSPWAVDTAGAFPTAAPLYVNSSSAASDSNLLALAVNGNAKFLVDAEGDIFASSITITGGTTLSTTSASTLTIEGSTTLGDATTTDAVYFNSRIGSSLIPTADNALDIGSSSPQAMWRTGYFGTSIGIGTTSPWRALSIEGDSDLGNNAYFGSFTATSTTATSTIAGGLAIETTGFVYDFTTGNVGIGTAAPAATLEVNGDIKMNLASFLKWDNNNFIQPASNIFPFKTSQSLGFYFYTNYDTETSNPELVIDDSGNIGIGQTTPTYNLDVTGLARFTGLVDASHFVATTTATSTLAGGLTIAGQCVTADTRLRRRRRRKDVLGDDDFEEEEFGKTLGVKEEWSDGKTPSVEENSTENTALANGASDPMPHTVWTRFVTSMIANTFGLSSKRGVSVDNEIIQPAKGVEPLGLRMTNLAPHQVAGLRKLYHKGATYIADNNYIYDETRIDEVKENDEIQSLDEKTGVLVWSKVNKLMYMGVKQTYKLTTASGKTIRTTENHPYLVRNAKNDINALGFSRAKVFIDYANIKSGLRDKELHINLKVLINALKEVGVDETRLYYGKDGQNEKANKFFDVLKKFGYTIIEKPVQYFCMRLSDLLKQHNNQELLNKLSKKIRNALLTEVKILEENDITLTQPKSNFDIEIAVDALEMMNEYDTCVLFSGDGDFVPLVNTLRKYGKRVVIISSKKFLSSNLKNASDDFITMEWLARALPCLTYEINLKPAAERRVLKNCALSISNREKLSRFFGLDVDNNEVELPTKENGVWTKVTDLREGAMIAVAPEKFGKTLGIEEERSDGKMPSVEENLAKWDKIINIETLPQEDVYDIEVQGTHNFIGNDIVAHNTYLSGLLDLGGNDISDAGDIIADSILADAGVSGVLTLGGTGGTNNENLLLDFESTANEIIFSTTSGGDTFRFLGNIFTGLDKGFIFGSSGGNDARLLFSSVGNNNLQLGLGVANGERSGYFSIMEKPELGSANRTPLTLSADPVLRIYSSDADEALDYLEMYHNQTDSVIGYGNGSFLIGNGTATTTIDSSGNLGIGQTTPTYNLDVTGLARFTGLVDASHFVATTTATSTLAGGLTIAGQCVTADTRLRRRRRRKKGETDEDLEESGALSWDDEFVYDEVFIKDVMAGDEVASMSQKTGALVWGKVNKLMYMGVKQTYKLITEDGRAIRTTSNHPYLVKSVGSRLPSHKSQIEGAGWLNVSDIKSGDAIATPAKRLKNIYAFIDASNIYHGAKNAGFEVDYAKLKSYLTSRFGATHLFYFGAFDMKKKDDMLLKEQLMSLGYEIKEVALSKFKNGKTKADVDSRMTFEIMNMKSEYDEAVVITGDGDFYWVLEHLMQTKKKVSLIGMAGRTSRKLTQLFKTNFIHLGNVRKSIEKTDKKEADATFASASGVSISYQKEFISQEMKEVNVVDNKFGKTLGIEEERSDGKMPSVEENLREQTGIIWNKVVSITPVTQEDVYDIEVQGTHNFIGNDIVAHNTYLSDLLDLGGADISNAGTITGTSFVATSSSATSTIAGGLAIETSGFVYDHQTGNVGIGTAAPMTKLDVLGTASSTRFYANAGTAAAPAYSFAEDSDSGFISYGAGNIAYIDDGTTRFGFIGANLTAISTGVYGFSSSGSVLSQDSGLSRLSATKIAIGNGTQGDTSGTLIANNVGIGTTTPTSLLQVAGATAPKFTLSDTDATTDQKHWFIESDTGKFSIGTTSDALVTNSSYRALTIDSSGNVGIGQTTPTYNLDVTGLARFTGLVDASHFVATTTATSTLAGGLTIAGQCVTADTRLRRRRRRKEGETDEDLEKSGALSWDDEHVYDEVFIKDVMAGDEIASMSQKTGEIVWSEVIEKMNMGIQDIYQLTTQSGKKIRTTDNHPYFVRGKYDDDNLLKNTRPKTQKLYKFEVDQSIKIEEFSRDSVIAISNKENSFAVAVPSKIKQTLRDNLRRNQTQKFNAKVFALAIVKAVEKIEATVHELVIDIEYAGYDEYIANVIKITFPTIEISFVQIGKRSPAHYVAYYGHTGKRAVDYSLNIEDITRQTENALRWSFLSHSPKRGKSPDTPQALLTKRVYDSEEFVKSGEWIKVKDIKEGQMLAVTYGNNIVWERITNIEKQEKETVYDVEIEKTRNFIGNDIVAHNTYLSDLLDLGGNDIKNVGDIALDSLSSDAGTSINVTLGSDAGDDFIIDTTGFVYEGDNNYVGIGTAAPNELLHILTSGTSGYTNAVNRGILITDNVDPRLTFEDAGEGTNDRIMQLRYIDENLTFSSLTDDGNNWDVEKIMVVNRDGNVGIGTTSPYSKLTVWGAGTSGASAFEVVDNASSTLMSVLDDGQCVTGDSELVTESGEILRIDEVKGGELVYSLDQETGKLVPARIKGLLDMGVRTIYKIETEDGKTIRTTGNHPYLAIQTIQKENNTSNVEDAVFDFVDKIGRATSTMSRGQSSVFPGVISNDSETYSYQYAQNDKENYISVSKIHNNETLNSLAPHNDNKDNQSDRYNSYIKNERIHKLFADDFNSLTPIAKKTTEALTLPAKIVNVNFSDEPETKNPITPEANQTFDKSIKYPATLSSWEELKPSIYSNDNSIADTLSSSQWTKVINLNEGDEIAVVNKNLELGTWNLDNDDEPSFNNQALSSVAESDIKFVKIAKITILPPEQVYDIEVEGTHNFVANGIIAHNTYISGNTGIGTSSPYAKLSVVGEAVAELFTATSTTATSTFFGSITGGNNLVIMESGDIGNANRSVSFGDTDPRLRVYSSDEAQANDYIEMYHDQSNGNLKVGGGGLTLDVNSGNITFNTGGGLISNTKGDVAFSVAMSDSRDELLFAVDDDGGNQFVFTNDSNKLIDHDHNTQTNPTLFIQSDLDPNIDNTEWLSITHTSTSTESDNLAYGLIDTGAGNLILNPNSGAGFVGIGTTSPYAKLSVWGDTTGNIFEAITNASSSALSVSATGFGTTTVTGLNISGSATSTSNVGINLTTGCFAVNGTCVSGAVTSIVATSNETTVSGAIGDVTVGIADTLYGGSSFEVGRDADNNWDFSADNQLTLDINAVSSIVMTGSLTAFNDTSVDIDFSIDGNNTADLFFLNAGTDRVGIASSSPWRTFSVSGDTALDSTIITFASTTASTLTVDYATTATSTIANNQLYAWTLATSTTATPIFSINTGAGDYATSTFNGGFNINSGALTYDASANKTSIERLDLGAQTFEDDAGTVSWIDLGITSSAAAGTAESYTAQIDGVSVLTIYGQADGSGGLNDVRTVIGTSTDAILGHANIPYGSLIIADGALCVDDGQGANCDDAAISRGEIAAETTTIQNIDLAENYPTKDTDLSAGDVVMFDSLNEVFVTKYDKSASTTDSAKQFLGVISTAPGVLLGGFGNADFPDETKVPVTLSGRVPVKVNNEGGDIAIGDRLTASSVAGVATKATTSAATLGVALEAFSATASSTAGTVLTFIDLAYSFADSQFRIDGNGNIAIGFDSSSTTTPQYKVHVIGDIAATSFVNISTSASKKDIERISPEEKETILEDIKNVEIAEYRYKHEDDDAPLRIGLIAEEAPLEVLSASGDGVDIYKLATFTLAGVQELALQVGDLETRLSDIEARLLNNGVGGSGDGGLSSVVATTIDYLVSMGVKFVDGITHIASLMVENLTIGSSEKPNGITLYDEATGEPYCVKMMNGSLTPTPGVCVVATNLTTSDVETESSSTPGVLPPSSNSGSSTPGVLPDSDTEAPVITMESESLVGVDTVDEGGSTPSVAMPAGRQEESSATTTPQITEEVVEEETEPTANATTSPQT